MLFIPASAKSSPALPALGTRLALSLLGVALLIVSSQIATAEHPTSQRAQAAAARVRPSLSRDLAAKGLRFGDPVFLRVIKEEGVLELFVQERGKKTFDGSRGWVSDLKLYDKSIEVLDLINTMLVQGLPHHYPMVLQNAGGLVEELAFWLGLKKISPVPYRDYMYIPE